MAGKSNMELMLQDENRIPSFLFKWWNPVIVTAIGVATVFVLRYSQRRPLISGIQTHILTGIGCFLGGYHIDRYRNDYFAERDAVLRHYLEGHPEDFPEPERKKFAEILQPWIPLR